MSGAVDWFRMSNTLLTDQRISRVAARCKVHRTMILGACAHIWGLADSSSVDGLLSEATAEGIDYDVGVAGFVDALVAIGWAEVRSDGVLLVGFIEKNGGTTSKKRKTDAAQRTARYKERRDQGVTTPSPERDPDRDQSVTLSTLSSVSLSSDSSGESEGEKPRASRAPSPRPPVLALVEHGPECWDYGDRRKVWDAYPERGRRKPQPAMEAIGNAAEWVATNRPDVGPPLAWLFERVKAYAKSDEGRSRFCRSIVGWMDDRAFNEGAQAWVREDGTPKQATREEIDRVMAEVEESNERLRNGKVRGTAIH
jgi:hypothetical protein